MSRYIDLNQTEFLKVDGNKEFNHGVDCCINKLLKQEPVKVIQMDKVKQAIEIIEDIATYDGIYIDRAYVLEILDKLIEESEE